MNKKQLSECCQSPVEVISINEGITRYACQNCQWACDTHDAPSGDNYEPEQEISFANGYSVTFKWKGAGDKGTIKGTISEKKMEAIYNILI